MPLAPVSAVASTTPVSPLTGAAPCGPSFGAVMEARTSRAALPASQAAAGQVAVAAARALHGIERAQARLDGLLAAARSGRTFSAQELMALQGEAYRYSQAVELSAKLVEQGAQAVKQALHAQV
jgi:hypothetical protein